MPYALDKKTLTRFLEGRKELDFSSIKTSELSRTAPGMDIQYIISTPYALALLHLRTNLNPKTTLSSLNNLLTLSQTYRKELELRGQILIALSKIPQEHKEKFAKIVEKISQESLTQLCVALARVSVPIPPLEECEKFAELTDNLQLLFLGTRYGNLWDTNERDAFKKKFLSKEHQEEINQKVDLNFPLDIFYELIKQNYHLLVKPLLQGS